MNPLTISIEVNFGKATLNLLQAFIQNASKPEQKPTTAPAPAPAAPKQPKTEPAPAPAQNLEPNEDLPVSDEELRAAVKAAKDHTSAAEVKAIFAQFGIKTSIECPEAKRFDLLNRLNDLSKR